MPFDHPLATRDCIVPAAAHSDNDVTQDPGLRSGTVPGHPSPAAGPVKRRWATAVKVGGGSRGVTVRAAAGDPGGSTWGRRVPSRALSGPTSRAHEVAASRPVTPAGRAAASDPGGSNVGLRAGSASSWPAVEGVSRCRPDEPTVTDQAVAAVGMVKHFGEKAAVAGVDLVVPVSSFFGLVGPNGAGKTTLLRMITGLLRPDAGHVTVGGIDVWADPVAAKAHFGVLPDDLRLFERLTGAEHLDYVGRLRRLDPAVVQQRIPELLAVLGLTDAADTLVADYSQGMRKKFALGLGILHAPSVLFLDEPFESVDPVSAHVIQEVLGHFRAGGGTVVFSSHVMDTVERLCDRLVILHHGRIVAGGTMAEVRGGERLEDVFVRAVSDGTSTPGELGWLGASTPAAAPSAAPRVGPAPIEPIEPADRAGAPWPPP